MAFGDMFNKGNEDLKNEVVLVKKEVNALDVRVEKENVALKNELLEARKEVTDIRKENNTLKDKQLEMENSQQELNKRLKMIEEMLVIRKDEQRNYEKEIAKDVIMDAKFKGDWLTVKNMCNAIKVSNETMLKYYLYEHEVYDIKINLDRNTFIIDEIKLSGYTPDFIKDKYMVEDGKLLLHSSLIEYLISHIEEMKISYNNYLRKSTKYKQTKKELESKVVTDYQNKINEICGTSKNGGYNKERWGVVYNVFRKTYPNLDKNYNSYKDEFGYVSKVNYVVTQLGLGNYLLRIACELYA